MLLELIAGGVAIAVFLAAEALRRRRLRARLPPARDAVIGELAHGAVVTVEGAVDTLDGATVRAPLCGLDVVWFQLTVEGGTEDQDGNVSWSPVLVLTGARPFALDDSSAARARVDPMGLELVEPEVFHAVGPTHEARVRELLLSHGRGHASGGRLRYREAVLRPREHVTLRGRAARDGRGVTIARAEDGGDLPVWPRTP